MQDWTWEVDQTRSEFYFLNFFTITQCLFLTELLSKPRLGERERQDLLSLLRLIHPDFPDADLAKVEFTSEDPNWFAALGRYLEAQFATRSLAPLPLHVDTRAGVRRHLPGKPNVIHSLSEAEVMAHTMVLPSLPVSFVTLTYA